MEESVTYQAIVEEGFRQGFEEGRQIGRLKEARRLLLVFGEKRFCAADEATRALVEELTTREYIETLAVRLCDVENWSELFPS